MRRRRAEARGLASLVGAAEESGAAQAEEAAHGERRGRRLRSDLARGRQYEDAGPRGRRLVQAAGRLSGGGSRVRNRTEGLGFGLRNPVNTLKPIQAVLNFFTIILSLELISIISL